MSLFEHVRDYADLSPADAPLTRGDLLVLSQLVYSDLPPAAITFGDALRGALSLPSSPRRFGFEHKNDRRLIAAAAQSRRFSNLPFLGFEERFDAADARQFAACALVWDADTLIVAFRGTDSSFAGWKEDFMLAYRSPVPAQRDAVAFLEDVAARAGGRIVACGHSKGGHLAAYAAAFAAPHVRARVREAVSFDGPGLSPADARSPEFLEVQDRVRVYIPRASLVGLLFEQPPGVQYIAARAGVLPHYPYTWRLRGGDFLPERAPTRRNAYLARTLHRFIGRMGPEMMDQYVEALFRVISSAETESMPEALAAWRGSAPRVLKAMVGLDRDTRRLFNRAFWFFLCAASGRMS